MNNQAAALTARAATELATQARPKAASDVGIPPHKTNAQTYGNVPTEEVIRLDAYLKWEAAGKPAGDGIRFWLEAETEARGRLVAPNFAKT